MQIGNIRAVCTGPTKGVEWKWWQYPKKWYAEFRIINNAWRLRNMSEKDIQRIIKQLNDLGVKATYTEDNDTQPDS